MKILQLCKQFPYPLNDGYSIAVTNLSCAMKEAGCEVTLLSMNTSKHYFDPANLPENYGNYQAVNTVDIDNRITVLGALLNLFSTESYILSRFNSADFSRELKRLLNETTFDVIQLESVYLASYVPIIRECSDALVAMRAHNVEHEIWERVAINSTSFLKKRYLQYLSRKLKKQEIELLKDYDILVAITERDLGIFGKMGYRKAATVTPVGINTEAYQPDWRRFSKPLSIAFIGSLDWMPNQEGVQWFMEKVWPEVQDRHPQLTFHIAGRRAPEWLKNKATENVYFHGEVESAVDFLKAHPLLIVPLFSGSGIRVKILEGMALGSVVVTTSLGMEGINAMDGEQILVADTAEAFGQQLDFCFENQTQLEKIGHHARQLIQDHFDMRKIGRELVEKYKKLIGNTKL